MSYIDKNLANDEVLIAKGRVHWFIFAPSIIFIALGLYLMPMDRFESLSEWVMKYGFIALFEHFFEMLVEDWKVFGTIGLVIIGALSFLQSMLRLLGLELGVTSKRIYKKVGIMTTNTDEMTLNRLESINIEQSIMGKIFNYGYIYFNSTIYGTMIFPMIANPGKLRKEALSAAEKYITTSEENIIN